MLTTEDKEYLKQLTQLLAERFESRLSTLERESNHVRRNMLTGEEAKAIFRTATLKVNAGTRMAVALIAAIAVIGNGTSNVLVDHTESKAIARNQDQTDRKLSAIEARIAQQNRELLFDVKRALAERDGHLEALIVKAGSQ